MTPEQGSTLSYWILQMRVLLRSSQIIFYIIIIFSILKWLVITQYYLLNLITFFLLREEIQFLGTFVFLGTWLFLNRWILHLYLWRFHSSCPRKCHSICIPNKYAFFRFFIQFHSLTSRNVDKCSQSEYSSFSLSYPRLFLSSNLLFPIYSNLQNDLHYPVFFVSQYLQGLAYFDCSKHPFLSTHPSQHLLVGEVSFLLYVQSSKVSIFLLHLCF